MYVIRDPLQGDITLSEEEFDLVNTYEMQRLSRVKQLGTSYLVYPGATHTRFAHSLGVRYLIEQILIKSKIYIPAEEKRLLFLAALLHDVSHPCFGHRLEEIPGIPSHEEVRDYVLDGRIKEELKKHGVLTEEEIDNTRFISDIDTLDKDTIKKIKELFDKRSNRYRELRELIDNYIDADNLDYIKRDSFYLGLHAASYDDRILSQFRITEDKEVVFSDEKTTIESIIAVMHARYYLYKVAYLQHTTLISDYMLTEAVRLWRRGDNGIVPFLVGDEEMLLRIKNEEESDYRAKDLAHRILSRNLYKRAYVLDNSNLRARDKAIDTLDNPTSDFEDEIGEEILPVRPRKPPWKEFGRILINEKEPTQIGSRIMSEIKILENKYQDLWTFIVATKKQDIPTRIKVYEKCKKYFFDYKGIYVPKRQLSDSEYVVIRALEDIKKRKGAALYVLNAICGEIEISTDGIVEKTNLKRSTVSQYLSYLKQKFKEYNLDVLKSELNKKKKYWKIKRKSDKDLIIKFIREEK
jgi:hypothetical protein